MLPARFVVTFLGFAFVPSVAVAEAIYANDFEDPADPLVEWSNPTTEVTPGTIAHPADGFLGRFSDESVSLSLADLPQHDEITVSFDLYVIHSWDGNRTGSTGPDVWDLSVLGGPTLLHTTFSMNGDHRQAYPDAFPGGDNPAFTGITEPYNSLGYTGGAGDDTTYGGLSFTFPHTADSLTLVFSGIGLQGVADESWGLDNILITPEPSTAWLLSFLALGFWPRVK